MAIVVVIILNNSDIFFCAWFSFG